MWLTRVLGGVGTVLLVAGCASVDSGGGGRFRGTSGPVAWEVVDIGQLVSADGQRMRWSYSIVFRETAGSPIQFERVERGSFASGVEIVGGGTAPQPFARTLAANSELRAPFWDSWGWVRSQQFGGASTLRPLVVERRFVGRNSQGRALSVRVRVQLDQSVGKLVKPLPVATPSLPAKPVEPDDLATLAGVWRGSYRTDGSEFDILLEVTLRGNGSFEAAENDPATNRFTGTIRIESGRVVYWQNRVTGPLSLHEGQGKRVLFGEVSGPRGGQDGGPPSTSRYTVRLESAARTP